jgi:MYXO-CTERM domain-containing protein
MFFAWVFGLVFSASGSTVDTEQLDRRKHLMDSFHGHMNSLHDHQEGERGICLTAMVAQLKEDWHILSPEERAEITGALAPSKADLFEPMVVNPAPPSAFRDTCWGTQKDNRIDTEHFSVQWDNGVSSSSNAQAFADSLEESWDVEVTELGWKVPRGADMYQMLVTIENLGSGAGAYTSVDSCGGDYRAYVVASSGSFSAGNWYKTMACHELHHAIQYAYGFTHEFWWWEATSTWIEDLVYPYQNDWASALYMFAQSPHIGMNASAGGSNDQALFWHTYGMGIWGMFLDQHVGGNDLVKDTWYQSQGQGGQYGFWMPDAIDEAGHDFDELMAGFMAATAVMDYRDRTYITDAQRASNVGALPADGQSSNRDRPQSLGMNFIEFDASLGEEGMALKVGFEGDTGADYWNVVLVRGHFEVDESVVFDLSGGSEGTATIPFDGDAPVHLVVSPVYEEAQGNHYNWRNADDFDYTWTAELVEAASGGSDDTGNADEGPSITQSNARESSGELGTKGGCACSSSKAPGPSWLGLMLVGLVGSRRRR